VSHDNAAAPITPAVLYGAKSTQDRHRSIPTQMEEARQMAEDNGWLVVDEFADDGFSAYSGNRGPGWINAQEAAVRAAAEHGTVCMLVAQAHDRFARGAGDRPGAPESLGEVWHRMRRLNVHLRTVEDDEELRDEASVAAVGRRAHIDSRRKSKSVGKGMRRRREKGLHNGGPRKYGFSYVRDDSGRVVPDTPWVPDPAEAVVVRRLFEGYAAGVTQRQLERELNREGIPAARGGEWFQGTISGILADKGYVGFIKDADAEDGWRKAEFESIISESLWLKVEALRKAAQRTEGGKGRGRPAAANHLFVKGLLRCECGGAMTPRSNTRRHGDKLYYSPDYRCARRVRDVTACDMPVLRKDQVDRAVLAYFEHVGVDLDATREQLAEAMVREVADVRAMLAQAHREERTAADRLARVKRAFQDGHLDAEDWAEQREELTAEQQAAAARVEQLTRREAEVSGGGLLRDVEEETLRRMADIRAAFAAEVSRPQVEAARAALTRLFKSFTVRRLLPGDDPEYATEAGLNINGTMWIEPEVRPEAYAGMTTMLRPGVGDLPWPGVKAQPLDLPVGDAHKHVDGLPMWSSAPASKARTRSSSESRPESTTTGTAAFARVARPSESRTRRSRSSPETPGRPMSSSTTSGNFVSSRRSPSAADSATRTS
jgi:site-specific DNA recombinase